MTTIHANFIATYLKPQEPQSNLSPAALRSMRMYSDWQSKPADWPEDVLCRQNTPHAFHEKLGRWVPTSEKLGFFADIRDWLAMMDDRKNYQESFQTWYDEPRPSRIPYMSV
jgi:hypothetical protein